MSSPPTKTATVGITTPAQLRLLPPLGPPVNLVNEKRAWGLFVVLFLSVPVVLAAVSLLGMMRPQ